LAKKIKNFVDKMMKRKVKVLNLLFQFNEIKASGIGDYKENKKG